MVKKFFKHNFFVVTGTFPISRGKQNGSEKE